MADPVDHPPHYQSAAGIEAIDVIEAFGLGFCLGNAVKYILRAAFRGYAALPPPKGPDGQIAPPWRVVLFGAPDVRATAADVEAKYRELVKAHHPDRGGDPAKFNQIIDAVRQAREELKA